MSLQGPGNNPPAYDRPRIHFAPGEITLFIKHRPGLSANAIVKTITGLYPFPRDLQDLGFSAPPQVFLSPERVTTFDESKFDRSKADSGVAYSLVFADIPALRDEDLLLRFVDLTRARIDALQSEWGSSFLFQATTPNWLACGAGQNNGSGGPGGEPVAPSTLGAPKPLPAGLGSTTAPKQRGRCVDIFILDTAPCEIDLKRAYHKWVEEPLRGHGDLNSHLDALIGPAGALGHIHNHPRIHYAGHTHLLEVANAYLPQHDYVMSDHGLFVASIINQYAPGARLHLIEVLNPFGVGTLESIANGFARAADFALKYPCAKVVVNASLFLDVGQADTDSLKALIEHDPFWQRYLVDQNGNHIADENELNMLVEPLRVVCEFLRNQAAVEIIAAAGNDGRTIRDSQGNNVPFHPIARFPAAYPTVTGVGARNFDDSVSLYSNQSDRPPVDGVETFGGNVIGDRSDPEFGALGVYIGTFPDRTPNQYGLARWSGTSFATPMVTGLVAALLCDGMPPADVIPAIQDALASASTEPQGEGVA